LCWHSWELAVVRKKREQNSTLLIHFAKSAALAAAFFTTLIENLRICSSAEAGLFLSFEQK